MPVVFNPITTTIASIMSIPQNPGSEFIIAAYSSIHLSNDKGHLMIINPTPNFATYTSNMADLARQKGYKKAAMVA